MLQRNIGHFCISFWNDHLCTLDMPWHHPTKLLFFCSFWSYVSMCFLICSLVFCSKPEVCQAGFLKSLYLSEISVALDWTSPVGLSHIPGWTPSISLTQHRQNFLKLFMMKLLKLIWMKFSWPRPWEEFISFSISSHLPISKSNRETSPIKLWCLFRLKGFEDTQLDDQTCPSPSYFKPKSFPWLHAVEEIQDVSLHDHRKVFSYKYGCKISF